jgi:hypothetical protein
MNALEKSDLPEVARKRAKQSDLGCGRSLRSEEAGPRRMRNCKARSGRRAG